MRSPPKDLTEGVFNENVAYFFYVGGQTFQKKLFWEVESIIFTFCVVYFLLSFYTFYKCFLKLHLTKSYW
jgi:hypothetical protein